MNPTAVTTFLLLTLAIGSISWLQTRRQKLNTVSGFFFANRSLNFWVVGGALFFTNINASQFIGENESVYTNNMSVMAWGMTSVFAMLLVSEFIMPVYFKSGISTTPDFLGERFDASIKRWVSVLFLISYLVNMLPSVLYSGAVAFNGLFHLSDSMGISHWKMICLLCGVIGIIGCAYSIAGGIRVVAVSDVLLGICMFAAGLLLVYYGLRFLGKGNPHTGLRTILSNKTEHLNSIGSSRDAVPFGTLFTGMLLMNLYYWGTEQYIVQQALISKSLADTQKGIALACFGKIVSPLLLNIPALIAVHLYMHLENTAEVFPALVSTVSPPVLSGFIAAVVLGATLTSFAPGLNSASTLFVLNLYKPYKEKGGKLLSETNVIQVAKRFEIVACGIAICIAPLIMLYKKGFYAYLQTVGGCFSVPVFTILLVGLATRNVPPVAAKVGLGFFIVSYLISQLLYDGNLHFLHILAILFCVTVLLMLVIGKFKPSPFPYRQHQRNVVDISPWKNRYVFMILILCMMAGMFLLFSRIGIAT